MANNVKIKFGLRQQATVQFGHKNRLIFKVRTSQEFTEGTYNAASTAREHRLRLFTKGGGVILWEVAAAVKLIAPQHKAAPFSGDMLHGGGPRCPVIGGGRAINFNA